MSMGRLPEYRTVLSATGRTHAPISGAGLAHRSSDPMRPAASAADSLAKWGSSGLLAVRDMGAGDLALTLQVLTYCAEHVDDIDMSGAPGIPPEGGPARADSGVVAQQQWQRVGERFKAFRSLEAACCSTEARVSAVARRAGFADASECLDAPDGALPSTETFARRVAGALGFATGEHFLSPAGIAGGMFGGARLGDLLVAHVGKSCRLRGTDDGEGSAAGRHIGEDGAGSGRDEGVGTGGSDGAGLGDAAGGGLEGGATQERARGLLEWTDEVVRELLCLPGIREQLVICVVLGQTGLEEEVRGASVWGRCTHPG